MKSNMIKLVVLMFSVLFLCSCASIQEKYNELKHKENATEVESIFCTDAKNRCNLYSIHDIPPCVCECGDLEIVGTFFIDNDIDAQLRSFIRNADNYLYCEFTILEDASIAETFVDKSKEIRAIKVILDKLNTMDFCDTGCLPKLKSQYNYLYENDINIVVKDNIHRNYCVSEDGVFVSTRLFNDEDSNDLAVFIVSNVTNEVYLDEFKRWN